MEGSLIVLVVTKIKIALFFIYVFIKVVFCIMKFLYPYTFQSIVEESIEFK